MQPRMSNPATILPDVAVHVEVVPSGAVRESSLRGHPASSSRPSRLWNRTSSRLILIQALPPPSG